MEFGYEVLLFIAIFLYIILFFISLVKRKYTISGLVVHALTYISTIQLIHFILFPVVIDALNLDFHSLSPIPFKSTIDYMESHPTYNPIKVLIGAFIYIIPVMIGKTMLTSESLKSIWVSPLRFNIIILLACLLKRLFDGDYVFDFGNHICLAAGSIVGIFLGKWIYKLVSIKLLNEVRVDHVTT